MVAVKKSRKHISKRLFNKSLKNKIMQKNGQHGGMLNIDQIDPVQLLNLKNFIIYNLKYNTTHFKKTRPLAEVNAFLKQQKHYKTSAYSMPYDLMVGSCELLQNICTRIKTVFGIIDKDINKDTSNLYFIKRMLESCYEGYGTPENKPSHREKLPETLKQMSEFINAYIFSGEFNYLITMLPNEIPCKIIEDNIIHKHIEMQKKKSEAKLLEELAMLTATDDAEEQGTEA